MSASKLMSALPHLLQILPTEWLGTTFANSNLLGRGEFSQRLTAAIESKGTALTTEDLVAVGNAEDYFRVASNVSTTLEMYMAHQRGVEMGRVFSFASHALPVVAVVLAAKGKTVHLHHEGASAPPFDPSKLQSVLGLLGASLQYHASAATAHDGDITVVTSASSSSSSFPSMPSFVDAVVAPRALIIYNTDAIAPVDVLVVRKRMGTPITTPVALAMLEGMASGTTYTPPAAPSAEGLAEFNAHLQTLSGTEVRAASNPVTFTAGLPSLCSLWLALIAQGGCDVLMCSTAYGGSNQLTDIITASASNFKKHTFDIQGELSIDKAIEGELAKLAAMGSALMPTTVLFVEIPTNPDMKVPDLAKVAEGLRAYRALTKQNVLLLVDVTFAPNSQVFKKVQGMVSDLPAMVFISMSKSVSRGKTTAGAIIANHTSETQALLEGVREVATTLDTTAADDQMGFLVANHKGVEERCEKAYAIAVTASKTLDAAVKQYSGQPMPGFQFVTPEQADYGFTTSTFSFNLPPPVGATTAINEALAQRFVDLLTQHPTVFKPCVSFGQDNGLVYATVPATSTQGVIKAEDKDKQAVGGVQLARLSFPPTCDLDAVLTVLEDSTRAVYSTSA